MGDKVSDVGSLGETIDTRSFRLSMVRHSRLFCLVLLITQDVQDQPESEEDHSGHKHQAVPSHSQVTQEQNRSEHEAELDDRDGSNSRDQETDIPPFQLEIEEEHQEQVAALQEDSGNEGYATPEENVKGGGESEGEGEGVSGGSRRRRRRKAGSESGSG